MSDTAGVVEQVEVEAASMRVQPPTPARLVATGEPTSAVVEQLLSALRKGEITSKFAREVLVRALPPAKPTVRVPLPAIVDAASYAAACRRIMRASATGRVAPSDAAVLLRNAKATFDATRADQRARLLDRR